MKGHCGTLNRSPFKACDFNSPMGFYLELHVYSMQIAETFVVLVIGSLAVMLAEDK